MDVRITHEKEQLDDHLALTERRVEGEPQEGGANLETKGVTGAKETVETGKIMAQ